MWYCIVIIKLIDSVISEILLEYNIHDKVKYLNTIIKQTVFCPSETLSTISFVLITLGAITFIEFLGAYYIIELVSMVFRLYVMPFWKFIQEYLEEKIKHLLKLYKKKSK